MENLKPNGQRAKYAILLIWIVMSMDIILLISGYFQYDMLNTISNGGEISIEKAEANDTRSQILAIIYMLVYIISVVTFIKWFRRAYYNLHHRFDYLSETENWAALSWFIPIISLYKPYRIMKELYIETKEIIIKKNTEYSDILSPTILIFWWTIWIINNFVGQYSFRFAKNAETIDAIKESTIIGMVSNFIGIPLALITIKIINDYSKVEHLLNDINDEEDDDETITENIILT